MKRKVLLIVVVLAAAAGAVAYYKAVTRPRAMVLTGIVTTDDVIVSPQVQGRLQEIEGELARVNG